MKQETPQAIVRRIEDARFAKGLKKGEICRYAGILNSAYSYLINRCRAGFPPNAEHLRKIEAAIKENCGKPEMAPAKRRKSA